MRISTRTKYDIVKKSQVLFTTIHLECGHDQEYEGEAKDAEKHLRSAGGTITHGGVTRCKPCTEAYGAALYATIKMFSGAPS